MRVFSRAKVSLQRVTEVFFYMCGLHSNALIQTLSVSLLLSGSLEYVDGLPSVKAGA